MLTKTQIKTFINSDLSRYIDECGEVNSTVAAEEACVHFDAHGPGPDFEIPEVFWDAAFEVSEAHN